LSPSMAREDLVKYGWSFRDGKDLCPVCTKLTTDNGQLTTDKGAL
jgi:CRISPR-associated protein Cas8b1/Cst1 subtype I-B